MFFFTKACFIWELWEEITVLKYYFGGKIIVWIAYILYLYFRVN